LGNLNSFFEYWGEVQEKAAVPHPAAFCKTLY
jgi:hypothetical protein